MATKLYRCVFFGGPWDGREIVKAPELLELNYERRFVLPQGAFHLYFLQAEHGAYSYVYQGARSGACAGK